MSDTPLITSGRIKNLTLLEYEKKIWKHKSVFPFMICHVINTVIFFITFHIIVFFVGFGTLVLMNGVSLLCCYWTFRFRIFAMYKRVPKKFINVEDLKKHKIVLFVQPHKHRGMDTISNIEVSLLGHIFFEYQKRKYFWDGNKKCFAKPPSTMKRPITFFKDKCRGYSKENDIQNMVLKYGYNVFDIPLPTFIDLFKEHALKPFFVFQVFCVLLWCLDEYWYYSLFTLVMLFVFEATVVNQRLRNLKFVRRMRNKPYELYVKRRKWKKIFSDKLLPYDIISIGENQNAPCDILLINGKCVTDESLLTGESTPQLKSNVQSLENCNDVLNKNDFKRNIIFGGTKVLRTYEPDDDDLTSHKKIKTPPDNGCVGVVLRTGFETNQGKLLRTILFSTEHLSANNIEALVFILFLLVFAIMASIYVLKVGLADPDRSRYKLILNCILIITSVVPPELPMELSLAVNSSLVALQKLGIYCTEPFRIPFAGKIDVCCFDKTGTLTSDKMKLNNVLVDGKPYKTRSTIPISSRNVLAGCQSLIILNKEVVGDPLEKAALEASGYKYESNNLCVNENEGMEITILKRFEFSSELKRMSVIAKIKNSKKGREFKVLVKGAPEVLKSLLINVPENFDQSNKELALSGGRVLALASRTFTKGVDSKSSLGAMLSKIKRSEVEKNLEFVGFAVFDSELKPNTYDTIAELAISDHVIVMITGDNPFTACHVAKSLNFVSRGQDILMYNEKNQWVLDDKVIIDVNEGEISGYDWVNLKRKYALCITGDILKLQDEMWLLQWIPRITIHARTTPVQKELVITTFKKLEYSTLMCGDGTNDVGGLKQANVGIALLDDGKKREFEKKKLERKKKSVVYDKEKLKKLSFMERLKAMQKEQKAIMSEDQAMVQLGDASIASPFTSRRSTIQSVLHIITQGRCTLVTTMQMYKILALNCLLTAYSLSVLHLDGVKFGDAQMVISGVGIAMCFLFLSRAKPLKRLSTDRPVTSIFALSMVISMFGQFLIHLCIIVLCVHASKIYIPLSDSQRDMDADYEKNLLNSVVFIMEALQNCITFFVNYEGRPFMQSLFQNKGLLISLIGITGVCFACAGNYVPDLNALMEVMVIPDNFRQYLMRMMVFNIVLVYAYERFVKFLFPVKKKQVV